MLADEQLHWLWWAGGIAITLIGLAIILWAVFADRARGRRRCPKCWYDLSHSEGMRCSECGHQAKIEKRLFRTRRRWKWAIAGLIVLLLSPGALGWRVAQSNWIARGPDTVLIASLWWVDDPSEVLKELETRLSGYYFNWRKPDPRRSWCVSGGSSRFQPPVVWDDELWDWQWKLLARQLSKIAVDVDGPNRLDAYSLMREIPDKRLVQDALIVGLSDSDPSIVRSAIHVCGTIKQSYALRDSLYSAAAAATPSCRWCSQDALINLLSNHRRHADAALPVLLENLIISVRDHQCVNRCARWGHELEYAVDAAVSILLITDIAVACDDRALAIDVLRFMIQTPRTPRSIRHAAVQSLCVLDPEEGVRHLSHLPQSDRHEVLRYTMQQYPDLAPVIIDLCLYTQNGRFADDAMYCAASETTPMDCLVELLGDIAATKGAPPPYEPGGAGMGGLLAGLRDAAALNAAPPPHEPGGANMGRLLSMFREIRKLDIDWYKCDRTGEFVMLPRNR